MVGGVLLKELVILVFEDKIEDFVLFVYLHMCSCFICLFAYVY